MVLDMEYREQELPEHGPGGPFFFFSARFVLPAVPASITTGLALYQRRLLLHEVIGSKVSWYVSHLIIITFSCMH
jgi:hypothetical protein